MIDELEGHQEPLTEYQSKELDRLKNLKQTTEDEYLNLSLAKKKLRNLYLEESYKALIKEAANKKAKFKTDSPKLYWIIRKHMSEESTDKIREHLGSNWDESERDQDPVQLWKAIRATHTAFLTGNPLQDRQQLRQSYADMKMNPVAW